MFDAIKPAGWTLAVLCIAYLLGAWSPGYWLVRWRTGGDVREHGSGGTGATNVGRLLGPGGFITVLLLDAAKGALAVAAARQLGESPAWQCAAVLAVIIGHVWPVQLGFRGGKGVAPLLGAWLVLSPMALIPCFFAALLALAILRRFTMAGLCGLTLLPFATWWTTGAQAVAPIAGMVLLVVLYAHREHLRGRAWRSSETPQS